MAGSTLASHGRRLARMEAVATLAGVFDPMDALRLEKSYKLIPREPGRSLTTDCRLAPTPSRPQPALPEDVASVRRAS